MLYVYSNIVRTDSNSGIHAYILSINICVTIAEITEQIFMPDYAARSHCNSFFIVLL